MSRILFNKFYGGISNDPNVGGVGSLYNAEGVEIRENSKSVTLAKGTNETSYLTTTDTVSGYNYNDGTYFLRLHRSGKITSYLKNDIDNGVFITDLSGVGYNIGNLTTPIGNRGFIITSSALYQWNYDGTLDSLGIYNTTDLVTNGDFGSSSGWTVGTNWNIAGSLATHTAGSTGVLSQTITTVNTQTYRVEVIGSGPITGTCEVKLGGASIGIISTAGQTLVGLRTATSTSEALEFIPSNDYDGNINNVRVQAYNVKSYSKAFKEKCPFIIINNFIYIGNGNIITEIDTTTDVFVMTDVLTIDLDYTIKGISKVGDQVFIYASNGSTSKQYLWNGVDTTVERTITWIDKNIVNTANWGNQDYIITNSAYSNRTGLWLVNGYSLQNIFINTENSNSYLERIFFQSNFTNAIETIGNRLLIPGIGGLYTYGQHTNGLPFALVKEYLHNGGEVSAMSYNEANNGKIVYSFFGTINGVNGIYENLVQLAQGYNNRADLSGFLETHPLSGECVSNIKNLEKITIGYKLQTGTLINLYTKNLDRTVNYTNIPYSYTTIPTIGAVYTLGAGTYTVYAVTDIGNWCILHTTVTGTFSPGASGTFTKSSGTGDTTFYAEKVRDYYKLEGTITAVKRRETFNIPEKYHELQVGVELLTPSTSNTPSIHDINIYYSETNND